MVVGAFVGSGFTNKVSGVGICPNVPSGNETGTDRSWVCIGHVHQLGTITMVHSTPKVCGCMYVTKFSVRIRILEAHV